MSHRLRFHIVDVFAERKYSGNQLAVVKDDGSLSDDDMQRIAREFGYSETTFIESDVKDGAYDVRIFTPEEEIPFAGHPTLGTAHVIREGVEEKPQTETLLNLGVGELRVDAEFEDGNEILWMSQKSPDFGREFRREEAAEALGLNSDEIDDSYPVEYVSTGLPTVVVPLRSIDALKRVSVNRTAYDSFVSGHDAKNILAFCPETRRDENDVSVRVFAPFYGVPEDPATGSSNGCLAGYLLRHNYFGSESIDVRVEQGHEIQRPSLLRLRSSVSQDGIEVRVGGQTVTVAEGELLV